MKPINIYPCNRFLIFNSPFDPSYPKLSLNPDVFEPVYREGKEFHQFEHKKAGPILSATRASSLLVIGNEKSAHDLFVRSLGLVNLNSQYLIPVRGRESIDQYTLEELKNFKVVYLYDYQYQNPRQAGQLLSDYLKQGGGLIVEGALSPEANEKTHDPLFEPLPPSAISQDQLVGDWDFNLPGKHPLTLGIDFQLFDQAYYNKTEPWNVVYPRQTGEFQVLLTSKDRPVLLAREFGQGKIVWMGFNLNYHINVNRNLEEMKLFKNIIQWVGDLEFGKVAAVDYEARFTHPERREVTVKSPATGILNKEYYFPVWRAYLEKDGNKQNLDIVRGGLDQQYVPLPENLAPPFKVVLVYGRWPVEIIGFIISGVTLIIIIIYIFEGILYPRFLGKICLKAVGRFKTKTTAWWDHDEEKKY